ncbi:MAG TPA: hypothetical protein VKB88_23855 [Bryobacteraceae bacterium]|nr:hypothetical protein [Bryobacteraceae bacterium]
MSETWADIDRAIAVLAAPLGQPGDDDSRRRALDFLLSRADEAHPRMLAALDASGRSAAPQFLVLALPAFARAESIPPLESILNNAGEADAMVAARALAAHPASAARETLLRALGSEHEPSAAAAADGLLLRGDPSVCRELLRFTNHRNREIRYHALQAAAGLGCIDDNTISLISARDADEQIRELARRLLDERRTVKH